MSTPIRPASTPARPAPTPAAPTRAGGTARAELARVLAGASYEVIPFASAEDAVLAHVPTDVRLTVTVTEAKGLERTLELTERLRAHGYLVAPHLAARLFRDDRHVAEVVDRLVGAGVTDVFVIAGDAPQPAGRITDALTLLHRIDALGRPFRSVGIGGYPEGHGALPAALVEQALRLKAPHATHVVTQLCFDAGRTAAWARSVASQGVCLPIRVGVPGPVSRQKLVRVSAGLGLGPSARFLRKQRNAALRFLLPGGYRPDRLVERLAPAFGAGDQHLDGLHVFTFNEFAGTEAWRQAWLQRVTR